MSKKRNQVQFTKPEDPKFLKLIKQQAGYRDGPTVDAKVCAPVRRATQNIFNLISQHPKEGRGVMVISICKRANV